MVDAPEAGSVEQAPKKKVRKTTKKKTAKPKKGNQTVKTKKVVTPVNETFSSKPLFRILIVLALLFGGLVLIAGLSQLRGPNPQAHIRSMMQTMFSDEVKTGNIQGNIQLNVVEGPEQANIQLQMSGAFDRSDLNQVKKQLDVFLQAQLPIGLLKAQTGVIFAQNDVYLQIKNVEGIEGISQYIPSNFFGSWIKINQEMLGQQFDMALPLLNLSEMDIRQMHEALKEVDIFEVKKELGTETYQGNKVSKYLVILNPEKTQQLFAQYPNLNEQEEQSREMQQMVQEVVSMINKEGIELWIGEEDNYLYKTSFALQSQNQQMLADVSSVKVNIEYFDYNKAVQIDVPPSFIPLTDFMSELMNQMQMSQMSQVQKLLEDHAQLESNVTSDLTLSCGDISFDAEEDTITTLSITPQLQEDNPYYLSVYITPAKGELTQEQFIICQENEDYVPVIINLLDGYWVWSEKAFWEEDGPCGDILVDNGVDQQACFDAIYDLQTLALEHVSQ